MWIVRLALRRPYTFVVVSLLLLLLTPFVLLRTPTDIFPSINIPAVSVVWQYTGLSAKEIEQRMVYTDERALTTTTCSVAQSKSRPPHAHELAQYCAPPQSWELPRLFCGRGKTWDLLELGNGAARMAGDQSALMPTVGA